MKWVQWWWHVLHTMWLHVQGRWYVFRNAPDWFVADIADIPNNDEDADVNAYINQARSERELRRAKRDSAI